MSVFKLYFLLVLLPHASIVLWSICIGFFAVAILCVDGHSCEEASHDCGKDNRIVGWCLSLSVLCAIIAMVIPGKKDILTIYSTSYITQNKDIQQLPSIVVDYLKKELGEDNVSKSN